MTVIAGIGFTAPWALTALALLPVLWILLRAVPPAPLRMAFPAVTLLLGLKDKDTSADRTPWWLLLLRCAAIAALIIATAGPVLDPEDRVGSSDRLLILVDGSWASAADWPVRQVQLRAALQAADRRGQSVAIHLLSSLDDDTPPGPFVPAARWKQDLTGLRPNPWGPSQPALSNFANTLSGPFDTLWISDGLERDGRSELLAAVQQAGALRVQESAGAVLAVAPPTFENGAITIKALRSQGQTAQSVAVLAIGPGPSGASQTLASETITFEPSERQADMALTLPAELRNRIDIIRLDGVTSAGAVSMVGDGLRRREVALLGTDADREGLLLLSPDHYLSNALAPSVDLLSGSFAEILPANPDVIVLADVAKLTEDEQNALGKWIAGGGLLIRFAGPKLAATALEIGIQDPLLPVQLRAGGRSLGGAMSWGSERRLAPFAQGSPFYGLEVPDDIRIRAQVLAQPSPTLGNRTLASLADGTPLVTRKIVGDGQIVLFHITANAEWSNLPLSGLFVHMLERLSVAGRSQNHEQVETTGKSWQATKLIDGFGQLTDGSNNSVVDGEALQDGAPRAAAPPGVYQSGDDIFAHNVIARGRELSAATWPAGVNVGPLMQQIARSLTGPFLALGLILVLIDALASMLMMGRISRVATSSVNLGIAVTVLAVTALGPSGAKAQDDRILDATSQTVLAHVLTGVEDVDAIARAGLIGLSDSLFARTSIEPSNPIGIDLERDELALYPLLYWPVTTQQPLPSQAAYSKLNAYLRGGGLILFDTRDADRTTFGAASSSGAKLQALALPLEIPPLEPVPDDHVLTRSFYLLQSFPGRYNANIWVEAAPPGAQRTEGMPFRNLNDNVTPVVIGGNDWAAAWAVGPDGNWLLPVGRGSAGERQREFALRFGINLVMHVLTGNYKSDQVHVPALLDRLGQ